MQNWMLCNEPCYIISYSAEYHQFGYVFSSLRRTVFYMLCCTYVLYLNIMKQMITEIVVGIPAYTLSHDDNSFRSNIMLELFNSSAERAGQAFQWACLIESTANLINQRAIK